MKTNEKSGLYFPSIEFQDEAWLKSSLVLWDCMHRIVPESYTPQDSDEVKAAIDLGLIKPIVLTDAERGATAEEFKRFVESLEYQPAGIDIPDGTDQDDRIHVEKVDGRLYPVLETLAAKFGQDGWIKVPRSIARGYMFFLANVIAKKRGLNLATDDSDSWAINGFYSEDGNLSEFVYDRAAPGFLSALTVQNLIPASIGQVSIKEVAKFSQKYKDERERFKIAIEKISIELSTVGSADQLSERLAVVTREVEFAKDDLKKALGFAGQEVRSSLLSYGLPVSAGVFLSLGGDPYNLTRLSTSLLFGAVAAYGDYTRAARNRNQNPLASFLLDMDNELLGAAKKANRHHRVVEEFIND